MSDHGAPPPPSGWFPEDLPDDDIDEISETFTGFEIPEPIRPINWNALSADEAADQWHDLDEWVTWLRRAYGLPATIIPPYWHRHDELVWELSALHTHWRTCYDPNAHGSAPLQWHHDFNEARARLREWVATCGTRIDRDRPTRQTFWPGEPARESSPEAPIIDREDDFRRFVEHDAAARSAQESEQ